MTEMIGIQFKLEAIAEYHEKPSPESEYNFFPAIRINIYEIIRDNKLRLISVHRCADIYDVESQISPETALQESRIWLAANNQPLMQSIIARISGAYDAAMLLKWLREYLLDTRGVTFEGSGDNWVGYEISEPENRFEGTFAEVIEWCYGEPVI